MNSRNFVHENLCENRFLDSHQISDSSFHFVFCLLPPLANNECQSQPCQNGATCVDQNNGYTCTCTAGWTGLHCENGKY